MSVSAYVVRVNTTMYRLNNMKTVKAIMTGIHGSYVKVGWQEPVKQAGSR
jgi:hypothetical protein